MDTNKLPTAPANANIPLAPVGLTAIYPLTKAGENRYREWLMANQDGTKTDKGRFMIDKAPQGLLWRQDMVDTTVPPLYFQRRMNGTFKTQADLAKFITEAMLASDYWKELPHQVMSDLNVGNALFNALSLYFFDVITKWDSNTRKIHRRNAETYVVDMREDNTHGGFKRHYRHSPRSLVAMYTGINDILCGHSKTSMMPQSRIEQISSMLLFGNVKVHNDIVENMMARVCMGFAPVIVGFVALFFAQADNGEYQPIEGISIYNKEDNRRPSLRSYIDIIDRMSLLKDIDRFDPKDLLECVCRYHTPYAPLLAHALDFLDEFKTEPMQNTNVVPMKRKA